MATIRPSLAVRNAQLDAINTLTNAGAGAGTIKIYTGTIPTNEDTAIGSQVLLGTLTFTDPAASAASACLLYTSDAADDTR